MQVTRRTPAKVNLCLLVGPKNDSGFHELFTVLVPVDVYDTLDFTLEARPQGVEPGRLVVECASVPEEDNLAARALRALESETGWVFDGSLAIEKRIPVGAGMGGGSSDAAAALQAGAEVLAAAGGPVPDASRMAAIARGLGADVPFFMAPLPSVGRGIGDILEPIDLPGLSMVLVYFRKQLSTASVYRTFDLVRPPESQAVFDFRSSQAEKRWRQVSDMTQVARLLENDLEQASFSLMQSLATDREVVVREGAIAALMTGSGPSLFGLCETVEKAKELQYRLGARGFSSMTATITV